MAGFDIVFMYSNSCMHNQSSRNGVVWGDTLMFSFRIQHLRDGGEGGGGEFIDQHTVFLSEYPMLEVFPLDAAEEERVLAEIMFPILPLGVYEVQFFLQHFLY